MKLFKALTLTLFTAGLLLTGCQSEKQLKESMGKILKENPEILADAIKENPADFMMALQDAAQNAKAEMAKKREEEEKKKFEESFNNPLNPEIRSDESVRGTKGAPIVLVEYSDFECPFCARGFATVNELLNKYKGKIQFIYKHLPLSFHKQAMIASQYYEAIRLQNAEKAFEFHDLVYKEQKKLGSMGEKLLKKLAKKVGANMRQLEKDKNSEKIISRIKADEAEAKKFGISGTPGFVINGIPVKGAYPASYFDMIIGKLKEKGKLTL